MYDVLSVLPICAAGSMWLTVCDGMRGTACTEYMVTIPVSPHISIFITYCMPK